MFISASLAAAIAERRCVASPPHPTQSNIRAMDMVHDVVIRINRMLVDLASGEGADVSTPIIAPGTMFDAALEAAEIIRQYGYPAKVLSWDEISQAGIKDEIGGEDLFYGDGVSLGMNAQAIIIKNRDKIVRMVLGNRSLEVASFGWIPHVEFFEKAVTEAVAQGLRKRTHKVMREIKTAAKRGEREVKIKDLPFKKQAFTSSAFVRDVLFSLGYETIFQLDGLLVSW